MGSSGPKYAVTITEAADGGHPWTNPSRAAGAPNVQGATLALDGVSKELVAGPAGLGFAIPSTGTITGIVLKIRAKAAIGA